MSKSFCGDNGIPANDRANRNGSLRLWIHYRSNLVRIRLVFNKPLHFGYVEQTDEGSRFEWRRYELGEDTVHLTVVTGGRDCDGTHEVTNRLSCTRDAAIATNRIEGSTVVWDFEVSEVYDQFAQNAGY